MVAGILEHANFSVSDPQRTADMLCGLFDWRIRWSGDAIHGGRTFHVGGPSERGDSYVAIYAQAEMRQAAPNDYRTVGALNHIGVVVEDLDAVEAKVLAAGFETTNHGDYEPGRRFYFHDHDGIEFEVVSYG
jgi:catechol 2,3-dioxygenase-like lactoylglutathione lyase family enzyme